MVCYRPTDSLKACIFAGADVHGASPPLYSDMEKVDNQGGWERHARVYLEHSDIAWLPNAASSLLSSAALVIWPESSLRQFGT